MKTCLYLLAAGLVVFGIIRVRTGLIESAFFADLRRGRFEDVEKTLASHPGLAVLALPTGETALRIAASSQYSPTPPSAEARLSCVRKLLDLGADVQSRDSLGYTALHGAATKEIAELFLERGAILDAKGPHGVQPIHSNPHSDVIQLLIQRGADVNARNEHGGTPLHQRASVGDLESVKILLANGAELNALDKESETPLFEAVGMGQVKTAAYLIEHGADLNRRNRRGLTPLKWAKELTADSDAKLKEGEIRMIELLVRSGATE